MIKFKTQKVIEVQDWDDLVQKTYGRPYAFQQQDDCKDRGIEWFTIPIQHPYDYEDATIPEVVNHQDMGVSFQAWLERDPNKPLENQERDYELIFWWKRNFYPSVDMVLNDLHKRGILEAGDYGIDIDW